MNGKLVHVTRPIVYMTRLTAQSLYRTVANFVQNCDDRLAFFTVIGFLVLQNWVFSVLFTGLDTVQRPHDSTRLKYTIRFVFFRDIDYYLMKERRHLHSLRIPVCYWGSAHIWG